MSRVARPGEVPGGGSLTKLAYSDHARLTADSATKIVGAPASLTDDEEGGPWVDRLLFAPGLRIGGGTDEIQRNTIGEQGLGLPREPKPRRTRSPVQKPGRDRELGPIPPLVAEELEHIAPGLHRLTVRESPAALLPPGLIRRIEIRALLPPCGRPNGPRMPVVWCVWGVLIL